MSCSVQNQEPPKKLSFDETMDFMADLYAKKFKLKEDSDTLFFKITIVDSVYSYKCDPLFRRDKLYPELMEVYIDTVAHYNVLCYDSLKNKYTQKGNNIFLWRNEDSSEKLPDSFIKYLEAHDFIVPKNQLMDREEYDDLKKVFSVIFRKDNPRKYKVHVSNQILMTPPKL